MSRLTILCAALQLLILSGALVMSYMAHRTARKAERALMQHDNRKEHEHEHSVQGPHNIS